MAWDWSDVGSFSPYTIRSDASNVIQTHYEEYTVRYFEVDYDAPSLEVTFSFGRYSKNPTGYVIELLEDGDELADHLDNTEGIPRNYLAKFYPSQSVTINGKPEATYALVLTNNGTIYDGDMSVEVQITFDGGSGPSTRYFVGTKGSERGSIDVEVKNYTVSDRGGFRFELYSQTTYGLEYVYPTTTEYSLTAYHTFSDLPYGTYEIHVYQYFNDGAWREAVRTADNKGYLVIELVESWELSPGVMYENLGEIKKDYSKSFSGTASKTLYRYRMTFPYTGRVTFSSSGNTNHLPLIAWLSDEKQSRNFDKTTGIPSASRASDTQSTKHFSITYNCTGGRVYYLWFRHKEGLSSSESFNINISPETFTAWSYNTGYSSQLNLEETVVPQVVHATFFF